MSELTLNDPSSLDQMVDRVLEGEQFLVSQENLEGIKELMRNPLTAYRRAGVILAGQSGDPSLAPYILLAALDPESAVSSLAWEFILEDRDSYHPLMLENLENPSGWIRAGMINLLMETGYPELFPLAISFFEDPDQNVRDAASRAFQQGTSLDNPLLQDALKDEDPLVRGTALLTLARYNNVIVAPLLIEGFMDPDREVRRQAQSAASHLGEKALPILHLEASWETNPYPSRLASLEVIQGLRSLNSLATLLLLLDDPDERIRQKARAVLSIYGPEAIPRLHAIYETWEKDVPLRLRTLKLLGNIGTVEILPTLVMAFLDENPAVAAAAAEALQPMSSQANQALLALWDEGDVDIQKMILPLLRENKAPELFGSIEAVNNQKMLLLIQASSPKEIQDYLEVLDLSPLYTENILKLKEAWDLAEEYIRVNEEIDSGKNLYLSTSRKQVELALQARIVLKESFRLLHSYHQSRDPQILETSNSMRTQSRSLEKEARQQGALIEEMASAIRMDGEEKLRRYKEMQEELTLIWNKTIPGLRTLAALVYQERNIDPQVLTRESLLVK